MLYRGLLYFRQPNNRLWVSTILSVCWAVLFAFAAKLSNLFFPPGIFPKIELDTLESLLNVIASTMFAVSTFSLSIMVSAFSSASSSATPRATHLVVDDKTSRRTISSFISAFIYAIIAKTALGLEFFEQNGQFVLFLTTLAVLGYVIFTLIRWIYVLSHLGRLGNTIDKIYDSSEKSLQSYRTNPSLGTAWKGKLGEQPHRIYAENVGYLTHIDLAKLQKIAQELETYIHIEIRPGELVMPDTLLASADQIRDKAEHIRQCFIMNKDRSFDQDPIWGFIVLSEVAQRALSPAVNDPGTAIQVMMKMMKLLVTPCQHHQAKEHYDRLSIVPLAFNKVIAHSFSPIARDGGAVLEVELILQKVLAGIWRNAPELEVREEALSQARNYLKRAKTTLNIEEDFNQLSEKHLSLFNAIKDNKNYG